MNKILSDRLFNDFPHLYKLRHCGEKRSLMCFGFECGDGWFNIIHKLSKDISEIDTCKIYRAFQVKEKYAELRFYTIADEFEDCFMTREELDLLDQQIFELTAKAEEDSQCVCERCGTTTNDPSRFLRGSSWLHRMCDSCYSNFEGLDLR